MHVPLHRLRLIAIVAAVGVVLSRKPVYSALFLLLNFATLAALYIMLQAQFLAAVQVIVYAGAIVVLFLFVVMLIGGGELTEQVTRGRRYRERRLRRCVAASPWLAAHRALVLAALLLAGVGYGLVTGQLIRPRAARPRSRRQRPGHRHGALHRLPAAVRAGVGPAAGGHDRGGGAGANE